MSLDNLTTEARNPDSTRLDELTPLELVHLMNREDQSCVAAVATQAETIARCIEVIAERLAKGGRLIYVGAGTSGRLGVLDATECPPTFNTPPEMVVGLIAGGPPALTRAVEGAEDHPEEGEKDLRANSFSPNDVLVGIATSGRTPFVLGAARYAKSIGAAVIGLACNVGSELEPLVDMMICPVVGPEILSGSTRLKAGTATKLILNMLTTGAMVRLGKTFGNLMVDLRATNTKLKARTNRIVRLVCGLDEKDAADLLCRASGELKTALVMHAASIDADTARNRLAAAKGQVRPALGGLQTPAAAADPALVLGIDGGGSKTIVLLADGTNILGRGEAGPSNLQAVGVNRTLEALDTGIAKAFAEAGRPRVPVAAICLGLAGADRPQEKELLRQWVQHHRIAEWIEVTNDGALLLAAGTPAGWGVALVSGTGSIAVARSPDGRVFRCGGWGYILGDEGSGYRLATSALQAAAQSADGRATPTVLSKKLLAAMKLHDPVEFIPAVYRGSWDRTALSTLAPLVIDAADAGDVTAADIVNRGADDLARMVEIAMLRLGLDASALPLALSGGILTGSASYRRRVLDALKTRYLIPMPVTIVDEPARGAVTIARSRKSLTV